MNTTKTQADILLMLREYTKAIEKIYGSILSKVILFGSYARGDYDENSDIDVMIVLDVEPKDERKQIDELAEITADFNLKHDTYVMPIPKSEITFLKWLNIDPFYKNVNLEGRILYGA